MISSSVKNSSLGNNILDINFNNDIHSNPLDICNIFNNYFIDLASSHSSTAGASYSSYLPATNPYTMFLRPIDEREIFKIIMSLNNSKSCGHDNITTKIIKLCAPWLCIPLSHIINLSFVEGIFPRALKTCIVKPLFKKGDKRNLNNYRPIALIPIISKIFERSVHTRLNEFLTKFNLLRPEQFGFRKGKSTALACFDFIKYVTESLNDKTPIMAVFLDMTKAFDFVNHSKLLHKLERYGVRGRVLDWIKSYLEDRKQCTEISKISEENGVLFKKTYRSQFRLTNTGVPQGSILGPLLFIIYINDLPNAVSCKTIMFADDTTLLLKCNNNLTYERDLNNVLMNVINWMNINDLQININKTKCMQFLSYNSADIKLHLNYNNENVDKVDAFKFLGIMMDKHLNWKLHVDQVCASLNRFVFALKRLRDTVSPEAALTAYHGYVSSVLLYGLILWGNSVDVDRVFRIQKKCVRVICNAWFDDSCVPLFKKLHILPLPSLYLREVCVFVKKHQYYFSKRGENSQRQTRLKGKNLYLKPQCHKDVYKRNAFNMCIAIFNRLPEELKKLEGNLFKSKLNSWLLDKCFYSIRLFLETYKIV
jgi:hypothetical protein